MLCPVCLAKVRNNDGATSMHKLSTGLPCPMSGQPYWEWDEPSTRLAVHGRSGEICENCRQRRASEMHHRISRGVGGRWSPANILHLCMECHGWVTHNPTKAKALGLSVDRADDPERIEVQPIIGAAFYLSDDVSPPRRKGRK